MMKRISLLGFIGLAAATACEPRPANDASQRVDTGFAEVNGARLYYEVAGSGEPIVLIHGAVGDRRHWDGQFAPLAETYHVIRYDMRGYGKSSVPQGTPYSHHDDLKALLDHLGVSEAHVVGLSLGSAIAVDFVLAYPEMGLSLVSVGAGVFGYRSPRAQPDTQRDTSPSPMSQIRAIVREQGPRAAAEYVLELPGMAERISSLDPSLVDGTREMVYDYSFWHYVNDDPRRVLDPRAATRLGEIRLPTLIIIGEGESARAKERADFLEGSVQGARKVVIANAGHLVNMQRPDEFNRVLLDFLHGVATR